MDLAGHFDASSRKEWWLSHYPKRTQDEHLVAEDCTPGDFGSPYAPFGIEKAYRDSKHTLVFTVFLREPVARARSHYYRYEENGVLQGYFDECTPQQFPKSFALEVQKRMHQFRDFMYKAAGPKTVFKVLAGSEAQLYGLEGAKSAPAAADWLAENW